MVVTLCHHMAPLKEKSKDQRDDVAVAACKAGAPKESDIAMTHDILP